MISLEECKKHLGIELNDKQIESLRGALYSLVENVVDEYVSSGAMIEPKCKNQLSIVEFPLSVKK
jgi:hypothetical protein